MEPAATVIVFVGLLGAVVGSFLNVVIYRLPRGMSVHEPRRSFCPSCGAAIKGRHNLPIISWLWLRGRCHYCSANISIRYPVVEAATALVFITIWDQLFVARSVLNATNLATDWMLALGYLTLFACLLASAAMDIESYTIDIRVCILAMVAGVVAHTAHGLPANVLNGTVAAPFGALPSSLALIGSAMGVTWLATYLIGRAMMPDMQGDSTSADDTPQTEAGVAGSPADPAAGGGHGSHSPTQSPAQPGPIIAFAFLLLVLAVWQIIAPQSPTLWHIPAGGLRMLVATSVLMFLLILAAWTPREVDDVVLQEIEQNRPNARRTALKELSWLLPSLLVGAILFLFLRRHDAMNASWKEVIDESRLPGWLAIRMAPVLVAIAAMTWSAAIGWTVRILGTLAFGKEAYGTGDIYLMAAIGASAGVWNCFFGFFLASLLALIGVAATMLRRGHRAIPFGPWLALGSFCVLAMERPLLGYFATAGGMLWSFVAGSPY